MDRLVVDAGVAIKWFVVEPYSVEALRIFDGYTSGAVELLAPELFLAEVGNIAWKKHTLQGLPAEDASAILDEVRRLSISWASTDSLFDDAYRLAVTNRRSFYDSLYLALSLRSGCPFVTGDQKFVNAIGTTFPNVVWVGQWT